MLSSSNPFQDPTNPGPVVLSNKLRFRPSNHLPVQQQGVSNREPQPEGDEADGTGALDVADTAQGTEADKMNEHHLPTTNRGSRNSSSKDLDAERAGSSPQDHQGSSRRHCRGVTTHQQ